MAAEEEREKRKPRGRYRAGKACSADLPPQRKGALVEFSMGKSHYVVDVAAMYQKNLVSGHRRTVQRRGSVWYFDASSSASSRTLLDPEQARWSRYESGLQRLLEDAHREHGAASGAPAPADQPGGAPEAPAEACAVGPAARARSAPAGSLLDVEARAALEAVLAPGVPLGEVLETLRSLVLRHGVRCVEDDVRRVVLCVRSLAALQLVLRSNPDLVLVGLDVFERRFDKRFAGLKVNSDGVKRCLKALLARGARLGHPNSVPASKLLRKIEADAFPEWVRRYFCSLVRAGVDLPEQVQARIEAFL